MAGQLSFYPNATGRHRAPGSASVGYCGSTACQWSAPNIDLCAHITIVQTGKFYCHSSTGTWVMDTEDWQSWDPVHALSTRQCRILSQCNGYRRYPAIQLSCDVSVLAVDFSDPQGGKGPADRMSATCKSHITRYINDGQDVTTAEQMKEVILSHGRVEFRMSE